MSNEEHLFTCKECGCHDLRVSWDQTVMVHSTETLECECGQGQSGLTAERTYSVTTVNRGWGLLDEGHRWGQEEGDSEVVNEEAGDFEVFCEECLEDAEANDWEVTDEDEEEDEDSYEFYVHCHDCEREIEFGWSHPHRGGRIWPAECTDFNPWKCWPEPRFREAWAKKNWLRPIGGR